MFCVLQVRNMLKEQRTFLGSHGVIACILVDSSEDMSFAGGLVSLLLKMQRASQEPGRWGVKATVPIIGAVPVHMY